MAKGRGGGTSTIRGDERITVADAKQIRVAPDAVEIKRALDLLFDSQQLIELRALKTPYGTVSGYYRDHEKLARDAAKISAHPGVPAVYVTLQALQQTLMKQSDARLNTYKKNVVNTSGDKDVAVYKWLLVDCDPCRPSGVSSTDAEKQAAREVADAVREHFEWLNGWEEEGYPSILADSGNGFHVLVRIQLLADDESSNLVKAVLESLSAKFSTPAVKVDTVVYNRARICKIYGSVSRKGENTLERPHRLARLIDVPDDFENHRDYRITAPMEVLQRIASTVPATPPKIRGEAIASEDVEAQCKRMEEFLKKAGVAHRQRMDFGAGSAKWQLENCPFNPTHAAPDSYTAVHANGNPDFKCSHDSCKPYKWHQFRALLQPRVGKFSFQMKAKKQIERRKA